MLEEPIKNAEALLRRGPIDIANGAGKGYCSQFATPAAIERLLRFVSDPTSSLLAPMIAARHAACWNSIQVSARVSARVSASGDADLGVVSFMAVADSR